MLRPGGSSWSTCSNTFNCLSHWRVRFGLIGRCSSQSSPFHINMSSHTKLSPPTGSEAAVKAELHPCRLRAGGVKNGSEGRIIIGGSWWGLSGRRGVPSLLHPIPALLPLLGSFPTLFISWLPSRQIKLSHH